MKKLYKYNINGCECWLTKRTGDAIVADIKAKVAAATEEDRLNQFFNEHILGKSYHGLDGFALYQFGHKEWAKALAAGSEISYLYEYTATPEFMANAAKKFNTTPEYVAEAMALSEAQGYYSDWFKDIYGFRPRYSLG